MTIVRPCVCYSVRPSVLPSVLSSGREILSSQVPYIFHRIHLKFCRLSSYDMKMRIWFLNFDSTIFNGVIAHADLNFANLVSATPPTSLIGFIRFL